MLKNYLKVAARTLVKRKGYALINVTGLAIGIAGCLLILLYVQDELRYDRFHEEADRIYRLNKVVTPMTGGSEQHVITSGPMGPTLATDYADVDQAVRLLPWFDDVLMTYGETSRTVADVVIADSNVFNVFSFRLLRGDPATALAAPLSMVLSETTARSFFGDADPVGQVLTGLNDLDYRVTGIVEDTPEHSHLRYNALISFSSTEPDRGGLEFGWLSSWGPQVLYTYLQLAPSADPAVLEAKLPDFMARHFADRADQYTLYLQPLSDIYLGSSGLLYSRNLRLGSGTYVYVFSVIALLILVIACINFTNLATARATERAREVGVRKVLGAHRHQLARQFLGEALLMSLLALLLGIGLVELALPPFNMFAGKALALGLIRNPAMASGLVGVLVVVGLVAGVYPAFVLARFRPARVLKGIWTAESRALPRQILVTLQFTISIILLAGTLIVYRQMAFMQTTHLGFEKEHVVVLPIGTTDIGTQFDAFKSAVLAHPSVTHAAGSNSVPGGSLMSFGLNPEGKAQDESWTAHAIRLDDDDLLATLGMEMAAGRYFSEERPTDLAGGIVINEALARSLGWDDPVGKQLDAPGEVEEGLVIGVVKDFHFESLHQAIDPLFLYFAPRFGNLSVRITGDDVPGTIAFLRETWERFESRYPFDYFFLDQAFDGLYRSEQRLMQTLGIFAGLAILVASLGLFGLAAFTAEQRTKEMGIRKVLGATAVQLTALLSKDFARLVVAAFVVAVPVAYLVADRWLDAFAYRIDISWPIFLGAGLTALGVALLTVSYQAVRTALANPVNSLRYE